MGLQVLDGELNKPRVTVVHPVRRLTLPRERFPIVGAPDPRSHSLPYAKPLTNHRRRGEKPASNMAGRTSAPRKETRVQNAGAESVSSKVITATMTLNGTAAKSESSLSVTDPATGLEIGIAPVCSRDQLDDAVRAARSAQPAWAALPFEDRRAFVLRVADVVDANVAELARLVTLEQGKPVSAAAIEVAGLAYWLRETADLELPEIVNQDDADRLSVTRHIPLGVVAAITPWNYPIGQIGFKLPQALLAGNTVVLKPSVYTPLATLRLGELLRDVLPVGVLNVLSGTDDLGKWMTSHPGFDGISFTGSTQTGAAVMRSAAAYLTPVTLELGGNDPAIVLPDVDVDEVADQLFWGAFSNSGQICLATKRLYIHEDVYDSLAARLSAIAKEARVGNGQEEGVQLGPVSNVRQYERVIELIQATLEQGLSLLSGGVPKEGSVGYFVSPTLVDNPPDDARIVQEEQFGPVLPLLKWTDVDDVVKRANATVFGLGASVWSSDTDAALSVAQRLQSGTVWINEVMHLSPAVSFGGTKQSGVGVENGLAGLLEYTTQQTTTVRR